MLGAGWRRASCARVPSLAWAWAACSVLLGACATPPPPAPVVAAPAVTPAVAQPAPRVQAIDATVGVRGSVAGRSERMLVYLPEAGDTLAAIAKRFLGRADRDWQIAEANGQLWQIAPGVPLIVPLLAANPMGVGPEGYQTVPILCYHRFGAGQSKMIMGPAQFEAQLDWLASNHYRVLRLQDLVGFLAGREPLPQRSVVITIDDGYESVYRHAYPALKKHGFSATLFVVSDFIATRDGLSWPQLQEMAESGVIDLQAHSKTHRNLIEQGAAENDAAYRQNIDNEVRQSRTVLERRLSPAGVKVRHFAYPFGDANDIVLAALQRQDYDLGVTVTPGGNAFFAHPLMLRRTMIFGDHSIEEFKSRLQVGKGAAWP